MKTSSDSNYYLNA